MRLRITSAALLAVLLGGVCSVGCGKKSRTSDGEYTETPAPVLPLTTTPVKPAPTTGAASPTPEKLPVPPTPAPPPVVIPTTPEVPPPTAVNPMPAAGQPPVVPPAGQPPVVVPPAGQPPVVPPPAGLPPVVPPPTATAPKDTPKPKEFEWPKEINGRDVMAFIKDCADPDPAMREVGLRTLPGFGPSVKKLTDKDGKNLFAKTVLRQMNNNIEKDPGVRTAAFATAATMGFEDEADVREAVRILGHTADVGASGGLSRQHAIQALAAFGPKAEGAVSVIVGAPVLDVAYETRRSIAFTLGKIGFNESTGPSPKALTCLTGVLAADQSAVVRLEALQSLAVLGPPWDGPHTAGDKAPPKLDQKGIAAHVGSLRKRLAPVAPKAGEKTASGVLVERDKQVELWVRFVLMRFETKEINDENLNAIAKAISHPDQGPRIQALALLGMMNDTGAKKIDDIVKALGVDDLVVVQAAINSLATLGYHARPALPELRKLLTHKDETTRKIAADAVKIVTDAKSPAEMMKKP